MKLRNLLAVVFLFALIGCKMPRQETAANALEPTVMAGEVATESLFQDLEGNPVALSDFEGKKIVVNYWATWCRPCIEEMPSMVRTQTLLKDENYIFLFPSDQSMEIIKKFVDKKKFELTFLKFTGSLSALGIRALPTTFIYNEKGERIDKIVGGVAWDSPEMIQKLKDTY